MLVIKAKEGCCEECVMRMPFYAPCNKPAINIVGWKHRPNEGPYRMCEMCTDHNVKNRGAMIVEKFRG